MPASPEDLFAYLDTLGIAHPTVTHKAAFTVEDARALRGEIAGGHTKNLFLKDKKDALFLVVALEDAGRRSCWQRHLASSRAPSPRSRCSTTRSGASAWCSMPP
jgi:hypothetical protein